MSNRVSQLKQTIFELHQEIDAIQNACSHPKTEDSIRAESHSFGIGSYYVLHRHCSECDKSWTTELPNELHEKLNSPFLHD